MHFINKYSINSIKLCARISLSSRARISHIEYKIQIYVFCCLGSCECEFGANHCGSNLYLYIILAFYLLNFKCESN
jgi:hypothetical protein